MAVAESSQKKVRTFDNSPITIFGADLFSGAGGFSRAAQNLGICIKAAVEFDPHACATYRHNIIQKAGSLLKLFEGDIGKIDLNEIRKCFSNDQPCHLVLGGPPCQGFSVHRIKGAGVDDPRNQLIHRYFETVERLKPKVFLLENVPGILWPRHAKYLKLFRQMAHDAGYRVMEPEVLDARNYGVPQRRKRVFILGLRNNLPDISNWPPQPTHGDGNSINFNPMLKKWLTCEAAFLSAPPGDVNDVHMQHSAELISAFRNTPPDGGSRHQSGRMLRCHEEHDGHKDVYGRIDRRKPAPTMTTACVNPSKGRFVHPLNHHGITVRQAARLQTFPDDFVFHGGIMAAARQIGNAVPVTMGEAILKPIQAYLQSLRKNHD